MKHCYDNAIAAIDAEAPDDPELLNQNEPVFNFRKIGTDCARRRPTTDPVQGRLDLAPQFLGRPETSVNGAFAKQFPPLQLGSGREPV